MKRLILSLAHQQQLYEQGKYHVAPPSVPHAHWDRDQWVAYIDGYGEWLP